MQTDGKYPPEIHYVRIQNVLFFDTLSLNR